MPTLYLICGMPGAGESTLAKQLEVTNSAVRLCPDEWIEPLLKSKLDRQEMDRIRPHVDHLQWILAQRLMTLDINLVWEQGFWHIDERRRYLEKARSLGAKVSLHLKDVPVSELKTRIMIRNKDLPFGSFHIDPDEIDTWITWFKQPDEEELLLFDDYKIHKHPF